MRTVLALTLTLSSAALLCGALPAQNLYRAGVQPRSLIADHRAQAIGDILTITVRETQQVKNEDKVDRKNQTSLAARLEEYTINEKTFNPLPAIDIRQAREFKGDANQEQNSSVRASIAVIVIDVQPNGNLVVAGSRLVKVDDVEKTVRISGLVRPLDIAKDNSITSEQVADARIALTSEGGNNRVTTRGPIGTLFDTLIWAAWPF